MNDDAEETTRPEPVSPPEKPRGACMGCKFEYQLSTARSGDHKGQQVVRKHLSRVGPGECTGSRKPPKGEFETALSDAFTAPLQVPQSIDDSGQLGPWFIAEYGSECAGQCGGWITEGEQARSDGEDGWLCSLDGQEEERQVLAAQAGVPIPSPHTHHFTWWDDGKGHSGSFCACGAEEPDSVPPAVTSFPVNAPVAADLVQVQQPDSFTSPGTASEIPESDVTVSGQPDPDRDQWGRYLVHGQAHTRATTFAKLGSNTFAIEQWGHRLVTVGLTRRPDLLALAEGLEVKRDRDQLNKIVEQAREAAGSKVAANIGTAYHKFTERVDAGLTTLDQIPEKYRPRVAQYVSVVAKAGLTTRREWIERTTAVRADQVSAPLPVGGMLDRIYQLPDGSLCIGDLKTGDITWGLAEIEVQLAVYAHGVNTHGLFDWNTKTWQSLFATVGAGARVRTDFAIVVWLPADGDGCELVKVNLERGWKAAQLRGLLQADQKDKRQVQHLLTSDITAPVPLAIDTPPVSQPSPWTVPHMAKAREMFLEAANREQIASLYQYAYDSGKFTEAQLELIQSVGMKRLRDLGLIPA